METIKKFADALAAAGIPSTEPIIPDGNLHRYHVEGDRPGKRNGWYVLHADGIPAGAFGSWKHGVSDRWRGRGATNARERDTYRQRINDARNASETQREAEHRAAAARAADLWSKAKPCASHPYLRDKAIRPYGARVLGELMVLPVMDFDGALHSLEFIGGDGTKKLLSRGRKRGNFIPVHHGGNVKAGGRLLICEGFATGCTLAEMEPDATVIAAIDAYNLYPVAVEARRRWPKASIVICADADAVGREKANQAAIAARALIAVPEVEGCDFNDMAGREGAYV